MKCQLKNFNCWAGATRIQHATESPIVAPMAYIIPINNYENYLLLLVAFACYVPHNGKLLTANEGVFHKLALCLLPNERKNVSRVKQYTIYKIQSSNCEILQDSYQ